jgi:hypothetical protein
MKTQTDRQMLPVLLSLACPTHSWTPGDLLGSLLSGERVVVHFVIVTVLGRLEVVASMFPVQSEIATVGQLVE